MSWSWTTSSPAETQALGAMVMDIMGGAGVLLLEGDLGAGKTCFVQGLAQALGIQDSVTSPTYSLIKTYGDPVTLVHGDLYRLQDEEELYELGLEEWLDAQVIFAVEWPSRAQHLWRPSDWRMKLQSMPEHLDGRVVNLWQGEGT